MVGSAGQGGATMADGGHDACNDWLSVQELKLSYYNKEIGLLTI